MKIYTKRGDDGTTSLFGGRRVSKNELRIEVYGTVDELNSWTGFLRDHEEASSYRDLLKSLQDHLFAAGSVFATDPEKSDTLAISFDANAATDLLETEIDKMETSLPELKNFVLPGGLKANSVAHICRCVCRRAERLAVALSQNEKVDADLLGFLNRLSDFYFVLARKLSADSGAEEVTWKGQ